MRIRSFVLPTVATAVVLLGPVLGYEAAVRTGKTPAKARHLYRIEYGLAVQEAGKAPVTSTFLMNVEDGDTGEVHVGENIPLVTASSPSGMSAPRQDVGVKIHCNPTRAGEDLLLRTNLELSGAGEPVGSLGATPIHKVTASDEVLVSLNKTAVVVTMEQPTSHVRYELTVKATKLL